MNFLKKLFLRPVTISVITVVVLAFGVLATFNMDTNLLPDISYPALGVTVAYPGASAETCDEDVRPTLENALRTISSVKSITTQCVENAAIAAVLFEYGTDVDKKTNEIRDRLALVSFPENCLDPIYTQIDFNGMAVATVAVYDPEDESKAYEEADVVMQRLLAIEGVGSVSVIGKPEESIMVTPINGLEIATLLIVQTLMTNDQLDIPLGSLVQGGSSVSFRNLSSADTIEDIKATPIQIPLTRSLGTALQTATRAMDFVQNTSSADMQNLYDNLWEAYDGFVSYEPSTGDDILAGIETAIDFDRLGTALNDAGLTELADRIDELHTYITDNPESLEGLSDAIKDLQAVVGGTLDENFWNSFSAVIEFKREHEHVDENGETVGDQLTAADYAELFGKIDLSMPMTLTDRLVGFLMDKKEALENLQYDSSDEAKLNVRIGDIADVFVDDGTASPSSYAYYNGVRAVTLEVYGISGANTTAITEKVREVLATSDDLGSELVLLNDRSQFISDSIHNVLSSMLIGGALAILVIYVFLRKVRSSLIIAITMPLSVLAAIVCLYFMGITMNMVSLGGLAVGIGMLVDNSIVILESITFERDKGKSALQAAVDGTKLVAGSLLASTLTSVCVFFPLLFTKGLTEMIFSDLSWSVIFSLVFSLLVAVTVIPTLYVAVYNDKMMLKGKLFEKTKKLKKTSHANATPANVTSGNVTSENVTSESVTPASVTSDSVITPDNDVTPIKAKKKEKKKRRGIMATLMAFYEGFLRRALRHRWLVLLVALVVFGASTALIFTTGMEFMPSVDQRTIEIKINFSPIELVADCEQKTIDVYNLIYEKVPDIDKLSVTVGNTGLLSTAPSGTIRVILKDGGIQTKKAVSIIRELVADKDLRITVTEEDGVLASLMSGVGGFANISVTVVGDDEEVLKEIAQKVRERAVYEGSYFTGVTDNMSQTMPEYRIRIDKMRCYELGVDYTVAAATLRAGIAGIAACKAEIGDDSVNVTVTFSDGTLDGYYGGFENFLIGVDGDGNAVTLGSVADIELCETRTVIMKSNGKNLINISAESEGVDSGTANKEFTKIVTEVLSEYEGYNFEESGVNHYMEEVFDGLTVSLIVAFFLLFAVMACQFESLAKPFIVIFAIPLSFTGGFLALFITGMSLNVVSFVGLIMLMGVVVNDAIVMIDRIAQLEEDGLSRYDALIEGSKSRMRAIWMTTLTTVLALIPLALGVGKGAELMQPLAIAVIGGLTLATLVTLILIPTAYSLVKRVPIPRAKKNKSADSSVSAAEDTSSANTVSENTSPATDAENTATANGTKNTAPSDGTTAGATDTKKDVSPDKSPRSEYLEEVRFKH